MSVVVDGFLKKEVIQMALPFFNNNHMASETWARKYALRSTEKDDNGELLLLETTPEDMWKRCAAALASNEKEEEQDFWYKKFLDQLHGFKKLVLQGSPMAGLGNPKKVSLSNCYVIPSPEDNIKSIIDSAYKMAQIQAYRGGVGVDVSKLRPEGAPVSNAANTSSGAWSWCDLYSYVSRMIGQNGRVGALMITMSVDHPDILKFISMKSDLQKVTGANVSVRITDEFMRAVQDDDEFILRFDFNNDKYEDIRTPIKARQLWDEIVSNATNFAEPGILMWDNIIHNSPADAYADSGFKTISTNPCSEIPLCQYDSCRLASINLTGFVKNSFTDQATFDFDTFRETIQVGVRALDNIVDLDKFPFPEIEHTAKQGRRIGLGTHGLADCLAKLKIKYDSVEGIEFASRLYEFKANVAYGYSVELAKEKGPFPIYDSAREEGHAFLSRLDGRVLSDMQKYGRRNIALLTCAPTGTVSMVSCPNGTDVGAWGVSSGIEPMYKSHYFRNVKITHAEDRSEADFIDDTGDAFKTHIVCHASVLEYLGKHADEVSKEELNDLPYFFVDAENIDWRNRITMQAAMQVWIDHGISSTINLPKGTSVDTVSQLYMHAWEHGLKGVTIYVDGSRSGVLVSEANKSGAIQRKNAPERPDELDAIVHVIGTNGHTYNVYLGFYGENIYEVFAVKKSSIGIGVIDGLKGKIVKRASKIYDFETDNGIIRHINNHEDDEIAAFTRLLSTSLRYGVPIEIISEQLSKSKGTIVSMAKAINRVISQYAVEEIKVNEPCERCHSTETYMVKGCRKCKCGWSACG